MPEVADILPPGGASYSPGGFFAQNLDKGKRVTKFWDRGNK